MANNPIPKYKKLTGFADTDGLDFEVGMLTLVYLRMKAGGGEFSIASNIDKVFGRFDDIVVVQRQAGDRWTVDAVQLKHKKNLKITQAELLKTSNTDFGLLSFYFSQDLEAARGIISTTSTSTSTAAPSIEFKYYILTNARTKGTGPLGVRETNKMYLSTDQAEQRPQYSFNQGAYVYDEICKLAQFRVKVLKLLEGNSDFQKLEGSSDFQKLDNFHNMMLDTHKNSGKAIESSCAKLTEEFNKKLRLEQGTQNGDISNGQRNGETGDITELKGIVSQLKSEAFSLRVKMFNQLEGVADLASCKDFLAKVHVFTNQAHLHELDCLIGKELENFYTIRDSDDRGRLVANIKREIKAWWQTLNQAPFLTDKSDMLSKVLAEAYSASRRRELLSYGLSFTNPKLTDLLLEMPQDGGVFLVEAKKYTTVVSAMVMEALEHAYELQKSYNLGKQQADQVEWTKYCGKGRYLFVDVQTMHNSKEKLLRLWRYSKIITMFVDCNSELSSELEQSLYELLKGANENSKPRKLLTLILPNNLSPEIEKNIPNKYLDNFTWYDLVEKCQLSLIRREFSLQGNPISLVGLGVAEDKEFLAKIDSEACVQLLEKDTCWGKDLDKVDSAFVERSLKLPHLVQVDGMSSVLDGVQLLKDDNSKVVLLVGEPGMGKSTLIMYLANIAKEDNPSSWVAHIKINECIQFFEKYKSAPIARAETWEFLHQFALASENPLEKNLFNLLIKKLYIFIDGVDEICTYVGQVATLLTNIKTMGVARLWVATRPVCQHDLETKLNVKAHILNPIDTKKLFLKMYPGEPLTERDEFYQCLEAALGRDLLGSPLIAVSLREFYNARSDAYAWYLQCARALFGVYCNNRTYNKNDNLLPRNIDFRNKLWDHFTEIHGSVALHELFPGKDIEGRNFKCKRTLQACVVAIRNAWVDKEQDWTGIQRQTVGESSRFFYPVLAVFFAVQLLAKYKDCPRNIELIRNIESDLSNDNWRKVRDLIRLSPDS